MKNTILKPIKEWHTNGKLSGREFQNVIDLPVTFMADEGVHGPPYKFTMSVWKVPFWKRFAFLFSGKVNFITMGQTHPPVSITVGNYFDQEKGE